MEQKEHKVEFFISNIGGKDSAEVIDLNKIFQMNFSYNFDLLKNLIEALMKNQKNFQTELKEKTSKLEELESQLLDLGISSGKEEISKSIKNAIHSFKELEIVNQTSTMINPKLISVIKNDKNMLKAPPNDIQLDESKSNEDKINDIIVSIFNFNLINLKFFFIIRKK